MPSTLYLDAARMGQMTPSAQWALQDFVRVAGEEGCTLYFERFFRDGFSAWPANYQHQYSGLRFWGGVAELKAALASFAGLAPDSRPLLAGRSTNLMKLAASLLFQGGKRLLVTDLTWPSYKTILKHEARKANGRIQSLRVRAAILRGEISSGRQTCENRPLMPLKQSSPRSATACSCQPSATTESGCPSRKMPFRHDSGTCAGQLHRSRWIPSVRPGVRELVAGALRFLSCRMPQVVGRTSSVGDRVLPQPGDAGRSPSALCRPPRTSKTRRPPSRVSNQHRDRADATVHRNGQFVAALFLPRCP